MYDSGLESSNYNPYQNQPGNPVIKPPDTNPQADLADEGDVGFADDMNNMDEEEGDLPVTEDVVDDSVQEPDTSSMDELCKDGDPGLFYQDRDGDGFADNNAPFRNNCDRAGMFTALQRGDCQDNNALIHPDQPEICNGVDDNCNNISDEDQDNACGGCGTLPETLEAVCRDELCEAGQDNVPINQCRDFSSCNGNNCSCPNGESCGMLCADLGACSLTCNNNSTCAAMHNTGANINMRCNNSSVCHNTSRHSAVNHTQCGQNASCDMVCSRADSCSMTCERNSTCHMMCNSARSCTVECLAGATCSIQYRDIGNPVLGCASGDVSTCEPSHGMERQSCGMACDQLPAHD